MQRVLPNPMFSTSFPAASTSSRNSRLLEPWSTLPSGLLHPIAFPGIQGSLHTCPLPSGSILPSKPHTTCTLRPASQVPAYGDDNPYGGAETRTGRLNGPPFPPADPEQYQCLRFAEAQPSSCTRGHSSKIPVGKTHAFLSDLPQPLCSVVFIFHSFLLTGLGTNPWQSRACFFPLTQLQGKNRAGKMARSLCVVMSLPERQHPVL